MKNMLLITFAVAAVPVLAVAEPKKSASPDLMGIQGTWKIVSYARDGKAADEPVGMIVEFTESKVTIKPRDGRKQREGTYKLDPNVIQKQFDLTIEEGGESKVAQNIYKLEGDRLTICFSEPGRDLGRPTTFEVNEGDKFELLVLERVKPAED